MLKQIVVGMALAAVGFACGEAAVKLGEPANYAPPGSPGTPDGGNGVATGMPCEVSALLQSQCTSCHGEKPLGGAPMPLVTREHLLASKGGKSYGQLSVERMKNTAAPMPPSGKLSDGDIAALEAWVNGGMQAVTCGEEVENDPTAPIPLDPTVSPTCSSNSYWRDGDDGDPNMHPGRACIDCHRKEDKDDAPQLIAGTVYPSLREPNDCNGASQNVAKSIIEITDADGRVIEFAPRSSGNFSDWGRNVSVKFPIRARVKANGRIRQMVTPVTTGDCNSCHTQNGANGAPGRIVLP